MREYIHRYLVHMSCRLHKNERVAKRTQTKTKNKNNVKINAQNLLVFNINGLLTAGLSARDIDLHATNLLSC